MTQPNTQEKQSFSIQRVYVKDLSFENPNAPEVYKANVQPELKIDLNVNHKMVEKNYYEVMLTVTVAAKTGANSQMQNGEKETTYFIAEVRQCGLFEIIGLPQKELEHVLGIVCPSILFPYARETVDSLLTKGEYPPVRLAHINFESLYEESQKQKQ